MKRTLTVALLLVTVVLLLCLSSCNQAAIEISPFNYLPDTYEIVYAIYYPEVGITDQVTAGRDANGVLYYCDAQGNETVYVPVEDPANPNAACYIPHYCSGETGEWTTGNKVYSSSRRSFDDCYKAAHNAAKQGGSYEKIESLNLPEGSDTDLIFLDAERFEYYLVTESGGSTFETAVEKGTGICFYAHFDDYSFSVVKYNDAYEGNYADLLPEE